MDGPCDVLGTYTQGAYRALEISLYTLAFSRFDARACLEERHARLHAALTSPRGLIIFYLSVMLVGFELISI